MAESISVSRVIPSTPQRIYEAWLSGPEHGRMTGDAATYGDDDAFTAWSEYISGTTLEKVPFTRIVQSWRTTEFPEGAPDSKLVIGFEAVEGGTRVTLHQENLPEGQADGYEQAWQEHYFDPMTDFFSSAGSKLKDATEAVSQAMAEAVEGVSEAARDAGKAVSKARVAAVKGAQQAAKSISKSVKNVFSKKPAAKKSAPVKSAAKKPAPKTAPKKAAPKKSAAKKPAPKKAAAKKPAAKKPAPKKSAAKKPAPQKKAKSKR